MSASPPGNTLTLNGSTGTGIDMSSATKNLTNCAITLGASQEWNIASGRTLTVAGNVNNGTSLLTINGSGTTIISGIIGNGSGGLNKNGSGTLTLSGVNTYSGLTTVNAGELTSTPPGNNSVAGDFTISVGTVKLLQANQIANTKTLTLNSVHSK